MYTKTSIVLGCISPVLAAAAAHAEPHQIEVYITAAAARNSANVVGSFSDASGTSAIGERYLNAATTTSSFDESSGIFQESQNSGANSIVQNAISLAYISTCSTCLKTDALGLSVGVASNTALVSKNLDFPGYTRVNSSPGGGNSGGGGGGGNGNTPGGNGLTPQGSDPFTTVSGSFNHDIGIFSAGQNAGDNSLLQNSISVGAVTTDAINAATSEIGQATNSGSSKNNVSYSYFSPTLATLDSSFNNSVGVLVIGQNSGSNSLMQNSAIITYLNVKPVTSGLLAMTAAEAENTASLTDNFSSSQRQANNSQVSNSFNGSTGALISSQNVGANSIAQNAISVSAVTGN